MREGGRRSGFPLLRLVDPVAEIKPRGACFHCVDVVSRQTSLVYLNACLEKYRRELRCDVRRGSAILWACRLLAAAVRTKTGL